MNQYQYIYESEQNTLTQYEIAPILDSKLSWEDAYWIAKILMKNNCGIPDDRIIYLLEYCFFAGLSMANKEIFYDANECLAKLYMRYCMYDEASSKLMLLTYNFDCPDWVHLYFAITQIHTMFERIVEEPRFFFRRLLSADINDSETKDKIQTIFGQYLCSIVEQQPTLQVAVPEIINFAEEIDYTNSEEFRLFLKAICPDLSYPQIGHATISEKPSSSTSPIKNIDIVYFQFTTWLNCNLRRSLAQWLTTHFEVICKNDYWQMKVKPALNEQDLIKFNSFKSLTDFSFYTLLQILDYNLNDFYSQGSLSNSKTHKAINQMQQMILRWINHFNPDKCTKDLVISDIDIIINFTLQIEMPEDFQTEFKEFRKTIETLN